MDGVAGEAGQPTVLMMIAEPEYQTGTTLPEFSATELTPLGVRTLLATENPASANDFPGLAALPEADLLLISVRRHTPLTEQLALIRRHLEAGKPIIGIRTASHAFGAVPVDDRHQGWTTFDQDVLGGSYAGHFDDLPAHITAAPRALAHPILSGIDVAAFATRKLYRNPTLAPSAEALLLGRSEGDSTVQNVAWINQVGRSRIFYTSMGSAADFANREFRRLLRNAVFWALDRPVPEAVTGPAIRQDAAAATVQPAPLAPGHEAIPPAAAADRPPLLPSAAGHAAADAAAQLRPAPGLVVDLLARDPVIAKPVFLNFDERGRMWVVQYRQYPHPAGLTRISHDEFWRSVYDRQSPPPPHQFPGQDRITVLDSSRHDGVFDQVTDVISGLNIATAVERGRGGLWVLNPPYLLFYPQAPGSDAPTGDPIVHLSGFNVEDTHSVANSLRWGPDGWLYGAVGSTVTTSIVRPGIDRAPICTLTGQGIWRYHPESRRFEIFSEGGGNTFGLEIDDKGRIFSGHNGGDTRGFFYMQGAYEMKGFDKHGPLSNPYAFGYFPPMASSNPIARFSHNFIIYGGGALPRFDGRILAIDPMHGDVVESTLNPIRSTFSTGDLAHALTSGDSSFRPVDIKTGPDGAVYLCDWDDQQINHYRNSEGKIDSSLGRLYRIRAADARPLAAFDLSERTSGDLVGELRNPNRWFRQTALRLLGDRKDQAIVPMLRHELATATGQFALEALWALHLSGGLDDQSTSIALDHQDPFVRLWAVRLRCDQDGLPAAMARAFADRALIEAEVEVRAQLACSAKRLPAPDCLRIVKALITHDADADDPRMPLLLWWAIEAKAGSDRDQVLGLLAEPGVWQRPLIRSAVLARLMRRYATAGSRADLTTCARLLDLATSKNDAAILLTGFDEAFKGRPMSGFPDELLQALARHGGESLLLEVRSGRPGAIAKALGLMADGKADASVRLGLVEVCAEVDVPGCVPVLLTLLDPATDPRILKAAIAALQRYDDGLVPGAALAAYPGLAHDPQLAIQDLLTSRVAWSRRFLQAVGDGAIAATDVGANIVRKLKLSQDAAVNEATVRIWGKIGNASTAEMEHMMAHIKTVISTGQGDPRQGRNLFRSSCSSCHTLFGEGGKIGPDLTSARRDDVDGLLLSIVNPSAEIREGYETCMITTTDGRTLIGFVADKDTRVVALRGLDGQLTVLERSAVATMTLTGASLMPEGLLNAYDEQSLRDLLSYLRSSQPLPH
jgi:putative heme-binding domain-containing protein